MVTFRTDTLTFTHAGTWHDENGFAEDSATQSVALSCRPEPAAHGRKIAAPNGDLVNVSFRVFADLPDTAIAEGWRVTCRGHEVEVILKHVYQTHVEIWLG